MTTDGTYIYACMYDGTLDSNVILKIDPSDMSEVARWEGDPGDWADVYQMACAGGYLYVPIEGGHSYSGLMQIDTSDMSLNGLTEMEFGAWGVACVGGFVYTSFRFVWLFKIDPADMIPDLDAETPYEWICTDGTYLYGREEGGTTIYKVDPSDLSQLDSWDGSGSYGSIGNFTAGGGYLWAVCGNSTTVLAKIQTSDMTEVDNETYDLSDSDWIKEVVYANSAVYIGWQMTSPAAVYKIDPSDLSVSDTWGGAGGTEGAYGLAYVDDIYVGLNIDPAEIDHLSEIVSYTLTVNTEGSGSVTKDPDLGSYPEDTEVELTAVPDEGWAFDHWSGDLTGSDNPDTILMDGDKTVTAHFVALYAYSLTIQISGLGTVTKNPDKSTYDPGESVELTAVPGDSWFKEWGGDLSGGTNPKSITMSSDKSVIAFFSRDQLVATYTAPSGQYPSQALTGDGTSLWVALGGATAYLKKVGKGNMGSTYSQSYSLLGAPYGLLVDGADLFFSHQYHPASYPFDNARIVKLVAATIGAGPAWWGGATGDMYDPGFKSIAVDATYVYLGVVYGSGSRVVRLLRSDMTYVDAWTNSPADSAYRGPALCMAGGFLYVGLMPLSGTPVPLYKVNPATMATVDSWNPSPYIENIREIVYDAPYLYLAYSSDPAIIVVIDPTTMTEVARWTGETGQDTCRCLCISGDRVYAGLGTSPAQVVEIDKATMTTIKTWTASSGQNAVSAITPDFIYAALMTNPGKIVKLFFPNSITGPRSQAGMIW